VNAASIAEERGIRLSERKKPRSGSATASVVSLTMKSAQQERSVHGTVLHGTSPRLLRVDNIDVEAPLEGNVIVLRNRDVPGVIGRIGTVLGQHNINIANFSLGRARDEPGPREAVAVVQVDNEVDESVLKDLRHIDPVETAKSIHFEKPLRKEAWVELPERAHP